MRILLTGNIFHNYEYEFYDALQEMGHEVDLLFSNIHGPSHPRHLPSLLDWAKYGFLPHKLKINYFFNSAVEGYNKKLARLIESKQFDLMLVIGAKTIDPDILACFKNRKVLWFLDSLVRYEAVLEKVPLFDDVFLFEPTDIAVIQEKHNKPSRFLAPGFSPKIFKKIDVSNKYDFSFVGSYYPKRGTYLAELEKLSNKVVIYGDFFRANSAFVKSKLKSFHISRVASNELYNCSSINLNIHHSQSREGLSPRTFEIIGAGGFELVERQRVALEFFKEDHDIAFYETVEEFLDKAAFYLKNPTLRNKIALTAYEKARKHHTWKHRFEEMFRHLN